MSEIGSMFILLHHTCWRCRTRLGGCSLPTCILVLQQHCYYVQINSVTTMVSWPPWYCVVTLLSYPQCLILWPYQDCATKLVLWWWMQCLINSSFICPHCQLTSPLTPPRSWWLVICASKHTISSWPTGVIWLI